MLQLSLIEYTLRIPRSATSRPGDRVHVEADMLGKYVRRMLAPYQRVSASSSLHGQD